MYREEVDYRYITNNNNSLIITFQGWVNTSKRYNVGFGWGIALKHKHSFDILQIKDSNRMYYLRGVYQYPSIKECVVWLVSLIRNYKNIYIFGGSMGGFGSLLYGSILSYKGFPITLYTFSPQTFIEPAMTNCLNIGDSVKSVRNKIAYRSLQYIDRKYLNLLNVIDKPLKCDLHYGIKNKADCVHANNLSDFVNMVELDTDVHSTAQYLKNTGHLLRIFNSLSRD